MAAEAGVTADTFFPGAWASANYDDELWGIPFNVDVWFFSFYNAELLKAAGVDPQTVTTWEGLKAAAEKLTGDGRHGVGLFAGKAEATVGVPDPFIFPNAGRVPTEIGRASGTERGGP